MRVIAGTLKGRRLRAPTWPGLRPTSDKLRETLFNMLGARVQDARVLDGYAGSGAVGIEAISRGARHVTFVDDDPRAERLIAENVAHCGVTEGHAIIRATIARGLERLRADPAFVPFDIILLDPPYDHPATEALTAAAAGAARGGIVVLEHAKRATVPPTIGALSLTQDRASGDSALAFYDVM